MRHLIKKFPDHIANSLTFPGLQNSLTIPGFTGFPGLWEPCTKSTNESGRTTTREHVVGAWVTAWQLSPGDVC